MDSIPNSTDGRQARLESYYEHLLHQADEARAKAEEERYRSVMADDPTDQNYARWATEEEFSASLTEIPMDPCEVGQAGVPMLCRDGACYVDVTDSHSLIIGASGSKKSRLFIMPTILNLCKAGESMIVTDPKAELYERASGRLKEQGYKVYCINFRDNSIQNCWNPLEIPRQFYFNGNLDLAVGLLNDFATISIPRDGRGGDPFWDDSSRATFTGMLLLMFMLCDDPEEVNIRGLLDMRNTIFSGEEKLIHTLMANLDPSNIAAAYLSLIATVPDRTFGSILGTLDSHLQKFIMRPSLTDMLCRNDVAFHRIGHEKTAIFLVMPDEKETYHGLISLFIQQCYEALIYDAQQQPNKTLPRRVNYLLDEFSSLPQIKEFPAMISAARSRNIRFNIVVQSEKQLVSRYREEADTIKGNCNNWIYLYSRELETLERLCSLCGLQRSGKPLVTPSRLQRLDKDKGEVLIIHGRQYPFISHLADISEYDQDRPLPYSYEERQWPAVKIFRIRPLLQKYGMEWAKARFDRNSAEAGRIAEEKRQAELEEQRRQEEARQEELRRQEQAHRELLQAIAQAAQVKPVQPDPRCEPMREAVRRWYGENQDLFLPEDPGLLSSRRCLPFAAAGTEAQPMGLLLKDGFPLNFLSVIPLLTVQNLSLEGGDPAVLSRAARMVFRRTLDGGQMTPVYFPMERMSERWNLLFDPNADKTRFLPVFIARELFGGELPDPEGVTEDTPKDQRPPIDAALLARADALLQEWQHEPAGHPEYLVILDGMERAGLWWDAIAQSWQLGQLPNVQLFVTTAEPKLLTANVTSMFRQKENVKPFTKITLYFDDADNEVKGRQGPAPEVRLVLEDGAC